MQGRLASMTCPRRAAGIPAGDCTVIRSQSPYNEVATLLRVCSSPLPQCLMHSFAIYGVMPRLIQETE